MAKANNNTYALSEFSFRELTIEDLPELHSLDQQCFSPEQAFTAGYFALLFIHDDAFGWGFDSGGHLVAFILLTPSQKRANVATLNVHPDFRRLGLGRQLLQKCEQFLRDQQFHTVSLQVETTNTAAINLYTTLGYLEGRIVKNYYPDGDALMMYKKLA